MTPKGLVGCTLPHRCLDVCIFQRDRECLTSVRCRGYVRRVGWRSGPPDGDRGDRARCVGVGAGDRHSTHRVARQARMAPYQPCGRVDRGRIGAYRPLKRGGRFSMNARRPSS